MRWAKHISRKNGRRERARGCARGEVRRECSLGTMLRLLLLLCVCSTAALVLRGPGPAPRTFRTGRPIMGARKPGVSTPEDLAAFVAAAGDKLIVLDVRNPDFEKEPGKP
eukprot:scaffold190756_cov33-Tisochrysis_lutea.AAC.3